MELLKRNTLLGMVAVLVLSTGCLARGSHSRMPYYGKLIGRLANYAHHIDGTVYAVDENTIFIKGFSYDGLGPDAFFWVGNNTPRPSPDGYLVPYPEDYKSRDPPRLTGFNKTDVFLRLPGGKKIRDIRWLSVWCRRFTVNFGDVFIPANLEAPRPRVLPEFKRLAHGLRSGNITILDARTIYIPNLHYDGAGPDAYFWVGNGTTPHRLGVKVPNEMGSLEPLRGYQGEDIEIQLRQPLTVYDIDWLAMWCVQYQHNFGHVLIPKDLDVPPDLGQTKITTSTINPVYPSTGTPYSGGKPAVDPSDFANCRELLDERVQVRWKIVNDSVEILLSARIREDQYVAFGLSGEDNRPSMLGSDITVAFYDPIQNHFRADDYYVSATAQCDGKSGVCPDVRIGGHNDVTLLAGDRHDGVTTVRYSRPLQTNEASKDRPIPRKGPASVIAAIGPVNSRKEANSHSSADKTTEPIMIDFNSKNDNTCSSSLYTNTEEAVIKPWPKMTIEGESAFTVRIGPAGGKRGYTPITGHPSWGIAYWVNDLLIPEITVERGQTYTFTVEGGDDQTNPAHYHPLYITDSPEGGFGQRNKSEQRKQNVYAGVAYDQVGYPYPTAAGRYCEWKHKSVDKSLESERFEDYKKSLFLSCEQGEPATLSWTVANETPDLVYYQCYLHNNLGWKIRVVDAGYFSRQNGLNSATRSSIGSLFIGMWAIAWITFFLAR